jgi:outer membrane lipoprotein SlyB
MTRQISNRRLGRSLLGTALVSLVALVSGCSNGGEGALSGAALGAIAGMGLGSLSGDMGKGAAAGAIVGGLGGLILGDQNARRSAGR